MDGRNIFRFVKWDVPMFNWICHSIQYGYLTRLSRQLNDILLSQRKRHGLQLLVKLNFWPASMLREKERLTICRWPRINLHLLVTKWNIRLDMRRDNNTLSTILWGLLETLSYWSSTFVQIENISLLWLTNFHLFSKQLKHNIQDFWSLFT